MGVVMGEQLDPGGDWLVADLQREVKALRSTGIVRDLRATIQRLWQELVGGGADCAAIIVERDGLRRALVALQTGRDALCGPCWCAKYDHRNPWEIYGMDKHSEACKQARVVVKCGSGDG